MLYWSIKAPKICPVVFLAALTMGVPVKPMRTQLGRASSRLAWRVLAWERWASSMRTRISSEGLRFFAIGSICSSSSESSPPLNFWIIPKIKPAPGWLRYPSSLLTVFALCRGSPVRTAVSESCFSRSVRSVTTTILKRRSAGMVRIFRIK